MHDDATPADLRPERSTALASPSSRPSDPEFDPPMIAWPAESELERFRKVVVNPFLAVLGLVAWVLGMRAVSSEWRPSLAVLGTSLLAGMPYLIHYHCLDCGRTGVLLRCKWHACSGVVARWRMARRVRFGWPRPRTQVLVWTCLLVSAAVLIGIAGL
ncbi:hypothetical protein TA3x_000853 [Tundrisphaera sp. TA3]|uniref:hypothetical protein n=1 Tax=Tundrisphaera sp. TA3 TaxID=3435775 RepID=UPI003EBAD48E